MGKIEKQGDLPGKLYLVILLPFNILSEIIFWLLNVCYFYVDDFMQASWF